MLYQRMILAIDVGQPLNPEFWPHIYNKWDVGTWNQVKCQNAQLDIPDVASCETFVCEAECDQRSQCEQQCCRNRSHAEKPCWFKGDVYFYTSLYPAIHFLPPIPGPSQRHHHRGGQCIAGLSYRGAQSFTLTYKNRVNQLTSAPLSCFWTVLILWYIK